MDLGTIRARLAQGSHYATPQEVRRQRLAQPPRRSPASALWLSRALQLDRAACVRVRSSVPFSVAAFAQVVADVELVWSNCLTFNKANSSIARQAHQAAGKFKFFWAQAGVEARVLLAAARANQLPPNLLQAVQNAVALQQQEQAQHQQQPQAARPPGGGAAAAPKQRVSGTGAAGSLAGVVSPGDDDALGDGGGNGPALEDAAAAAENWAPRAKIVLKALMREECAEPFTVPVDLKEVRRLRPTLRHDRPAA